MADREQGNKVSERILEKINHKTLVYLGLKQIEKEDSLEERNKPHPIETRIKKLVDLSDKKKIILEQI